MNNELKKICINCREIIFDDEIDTIHMENKLSGRRIDMHFSCLLDVIEFVVQLKNGARLQDKDTNG